MIVGLDPGTNQSALVVLGDDQLVKEATIVPNETALDRLHIRFSDNPMIDSRIAVLVIEQVESFGMAVGREVFETVFWAGRFAQAWSPRRFERMPRRIVKQHLCHTARATDANIRTELIDRFGGQAKAIGVKKIPGPLYGIKSHCWAALALAVVWHDLHAQDGELIRPNVQAEF